jgi:MFS family permease
MSSTRAAARLPATFRSLRHRNYRLFFFGQLVSLIGTWMQTIAQQWLVYRLTGSAAMLGLVSFLPLLPLVPLSIWGGSLADRWHKRSILLVTQTIMMVQAFVLVALVWTATVEVWHVMLLAVILGAAMAVDTPARLAFVVDMVEDREDLTNAIGLNSTIFNTGRAIGPALAGVAVAATGEGGAFLINAFSFLAVIAGLMLMRLPKTERPVESGNAVAHMKEGVRYVLGRQTLVVLVSMVAVSGFLSMPYTTLLPVFATSVLGESAQPFIGLLCGESLVSIQCQSPDALTFGLLQAASGVGAVVGALIVASLPRGARRGRWLTVGNLMFPIALLVMAGSRSFALSFVVLVVAGFSFVAQNALANTLIQISVPDDLRGRVMSVYSMAFQGMFRMGGMQAGLMGDLIGAPAAVAIGASFCLLYSILVAWRFPKVRDMA